MPDAVVIMDNSPIPVFVSGGTVAGPTGATGPAGDVAKVADRTALAAVSASANLTRYMLEPGRSGIFVFNSSNLSAQVAADPLQGIYVAPASDTDGSSGAWVRQDILALRPEWFGAVGDGVTDCYAAAVAILDFIEYENRNFVGGFPYYRGSRPVEFYGINYYFSLPVDLKSTVSFKAMGNGMAGGNSTIWTVAASKAAIRVQRFDTETDAVGPTTVTTGGDNSLIEGFHFVSLGGAANLYQSGVWMRARASVRKCKFTGFPGVGVLILADVESPGTIQYGNANLWEVSNCRFEANKHGGMYVAGGDVAVGKAEQLDFTGNGRYGLVDLSLHNNTYTAVHTDGNGLGIVGGLMQTSVVSDGTYRYRLKHGQDASAAGTAPTAGTSNAVWEIMGLGADASWIGIPLYGSWAGTYVSGGSMYIDSNESTTVNGYSEGGEAPPIVEPPSQCSGFLFPSSGAHLKTANEGFVSERGFVRRAVNPINSSDYIISGPGSNGSGRYDRYNLYVMGDNIKAPLLYFLSFGAGGGSYRPNDICWNYGNGGGFEWLTGPSTTQQFGRGANQPHFRHFVNFALGPDDGNARIMSYGAAAPTTGPHGQGEVVFNSAPTAGGFVGWVCTTAGTPGTWKTFGSVSA